MKSLCKTKNGLNLWQTVVFKNYGMASNESIAKVIGASPDKVEEIALELGLRGIEYNPDWIEKGFVTVIRNNWDLLEFSDIALLLEISEDELKIVLAEYDFLDVKLGKKPQVESVKYVEPDNAEREYMSTVRGFIEEKRIANKVKPFDFFKDYFAADYDFGDEMVIEDRFTSSYFAKYSGSLLDGELSDYSDDYLKKLKATGTNGIWLSDTLRNLALFPFDPSMSPDYKIRIKNLKKLTERCAAHGIGVYLYLNEPRSLPKSFFEKHPSLIGQRVDEDNFCLCTSVKAVRDYVYTAVRSIAESVPLLKAVMTITMSENPTHCYSRPWLGREVIQTDCPNCAGRTPMEIIAEINNVIFRGLMDGNGKTRLIANVWGWANYANSTDDIKACIDMLDSGVEILCVSEYGKEITRGGAKIKVDDYSISIVGPSDLAREVLTYAKQRGRKTWAKIQLNSSWECSAVPFLPVFDLMCEHVTNVKELGVDGLMLGWSLGGYPGGVLSLCSFLCEKGHFDQNEWYKQTYGEQWQAVRRAVAAFSSAFSEYPFSLESIYFGAHNIGCANLWSVKKENRCSTMVCFAFDDFELWARPYGLNAYINQLEKLVDGWENGLEMLSSTALGKAEMELENCAVGAWCHFKSALNHAKFVKLKVEDNKNTAAMLSLVREEEAVVDRLYELISRDARIGFEMTNHYYYNENVLLEKLLNLRFCRKEL
ncbi:MAG: hypothetical protein IKC36_01350 [Clostridia bacterium]|nr:hypothetical protein [Clostridia bacterium]